MSDAAQKTFRFELVSPERVLASEPATMVVIPGSEGYFGVLPEHSPLLSSLQTGVVTVQSEDGAERRIFVDGGFADINDNLCTVLAEQAVAVDDLDQARLEQDLKNLAEDLELAQSDQDKLQVQRKIATAKAQLEAVTGVAAV